MRLAWNLVFLPVRALALVSCAALLVVVSPILGWSKIEELLSGDVAE